MDTVGDEPYEYMVANSVTYENHLKTHRGLSILKLLFRLLKKTLTRILVAIYSKALKYAWNNRRNSVKLWIQIRGYGGRREDGKVYG